MINLKEIMTPIDCTINVETTMREAIMIMKQTKWNVLPVTDEEGKLKGIFTRSELYQMMLEEKNLTAPITAYIKKEAVTIDFNTSYETITENVQKSRVGTGVVLDERKRVIGLLQKTDMVNALLQSSNMLKKQLETILENSQLGVLMTDGEKKLIYSNDQFLGMINKTREELLGQSFHELFPQVKTTSRPSFYVPKVTVGKEQTMLRVSYYRTVGGTEGIIAMFQGVTELEHMAQELQTVKNLKQTLDTAIDHAYDGILMIDQNRKVTMVSQLLLDLFDLKKAQVLHKSIEHILPQLHLETVFETGEAELSDFMEINGIKYIINRIPIKQDQEVIGALGKVTFRQLNQVSELYKKLEKAEKKAAYFEKQLQQSKTSRFSWEQIISRDPYVDKLKRSAAKAAKGRSTILIRGESGTGKELFAHAIHSSSARNDGNFVVVNCAAIPEHLLESEFFGYEDGAFTGARQKGKIGKFDLAHGGTLFLDEIGDMSLTLQAKLLRVLQEREFYRVGGTERVQVDVRIIAATNRHLETMVESGDFREDLYYRLNVITLQIPPLRERKHDIQLLIEVLMENLNRILGTSIIGIQDQVKIALENYDWPGNVRELRNVLERAMTFAEHGKIQIEDLPEYIVEKTRKSSTVKMAESAERSAIDKALYAANGNKTKAAELLGISRSGLYEKLKKFQL
ncbi:sigma-54-dependent Fis family transcriptional regulator [Anaerobacillus sp. CMMVII]|uniref:sigma-54-dependent Fis family transcriptional regulator n=1 Tax=Anaerobacillus sp. CMMVII TaxID=2755588 RepID=UPI0021B75E86|nr:sigma-54-dependent Fis family transcriptional regulator [Anaerobacillus sp. CMMVII]